MRKSVTKHCTSFARAANLETNFTWIIEKFSLIKESVESSEFKTTFLKEDISWSLILRLTNDWIAFNLQFNSNSKHFVGNCFLSLSENGYQAKIHNNKRAFSLYDVQRRFLDNDRLTVLCKVQISGEPIRIASISSERINLQDSFGAFFNSPKMSDVTLVVDGQEIPAHSQVLAMRSPIFYTLLSEKAAMENKRLILRDISKEVILEFLRFIYTNEVWDADKIVKELLLASILYDVKQLKSHCIGIIQDQMNTSNVISFLLFADQNFLPELKNLCLQFFKDHGKEINEAACLVQLMGNPDLIDEIYATLAQ